MARLELKNVIKNFGSVEVIKGVDLAIGDGEFVVIVGPSGCGKSTLLRLIAGLEEMTSGAILMDDERVDDVPAAKRELAMVFQSYALYPHMTVRKNLSFGLETMKVPKDEIESLITAAAETLQIGALLDRKPGQLSGGQCQRVAIGRAIVRNPKIFLFDEPLSNLDAELRTQMRIEINKLHQRLNATMIFVTHDQTEAMTLADRIVILNGGKVEQVGTPLELYNNPDNMFVGGFIGSPRMNFLPGVVLPETGDNTRIKLVGGNEIHTKLSSDSLPEGAKVTIGVRPESFVQVDANRALVTGEVQIAEHLGGETFVYVSLTNGDTITVGIKGQAKLVPGDEMHLAVAGSEFHIFGEDEKVIRHV
ncbi:MAG: sn-glycerol-3-phosphate ABC transporter ATP-binding protein UgpC [Gammaproteobacteria bacterium]|nr:sn-glycerol-3-phosphate ABC transporter ATP-binding protein UgpC [Gammaproteobacteria bacterium]